MKIIVKFCEIDLSSRRKNYTYVDVSCSALIKHCLKNVKCPFYGDGNLFCERLADSVTV